MSDFETRENPLMPQVVDILMAVGTNNYDVPEFIDEAEREGQGVSKRISITSLPPSIIPGVTRLFCWHPHAIPIVQAEGLSMVDLVGDLQARGLLADLEPEDFAWTPNDWLLPDDTVPPGTLAVTCAIQRDKALRREIEDKYLLRWHGGVILYTHLGKVRYVLKDGETELPEHLRPYAHMIDMVRVVRVDDDGVPLDDQDGGEEEVE